MLAVEDYQTFQALRDADEMAENNRPPIARAPAAAAPNNEKEKFGVDREGETTLYEWSK